MKKLLFILMLLMPILSCFSQLSERAPYIGISGSFHHDDNRGDDALYNFNPDKYQRDYKNYENSFSLTGEFGLNIKTHFVLAVEAGYFSESSHLSYSYDVTHIITEGHTNGIYFAPKYRYYKTIIGPLKFYCDLKAQFNYLFIYSKSSYNGYLFTPENPTIGKARGFEAGLSVSPGILVKVSQKFGVKLDYSLAGAYYKHIKKSNDSELDIDTVNSWDYGMNMDLSQLRLGIVYDL